MNKITEKNNPLSNNIDELSTMDILILINNEDNKIPKIVQKHLYEIEQIVDSVINSGRNQFSLHFHPLSS